MNDVTQTFYNIDAPFLERRRKTYWFKLYCKVELKTKMNIQQKNKQITYYKNEIVDGQL